MTGTVSLVGAGPGDPGLITARGLALLRTADAVVYDRLVAPELLAEVRPDAARHYAGRAAGYKALNQPEVNQLLVDLARRGQRVVRLKGGDPFIFGRGGEEAAACAEAGVPFEVVPGVSSVAAVPAYAGIPLTYRTIASSFAVVTGHEDPAKPDASVDWAHLATGIDTLVVLMGLDRIDRIVVRLLEHGRPPETPVAVISNGTVPQQRTVVATLRDVAERVRAAGLMSPAVIVVGEVVRMRETIGWFDRRPLFGRRILVPRTRAQPSILADRLREQGADVVEAPALRVEPLEDGRLAAALGHLTHYDWIVFTAAHAVEAFCSALATGERDARALAGVRLAAAGRGTAEALASRFLHADVSTAAYLTDEVAAALLHRGVAGRRLLLVRAHDAHGALADRLAAAGAIVDDAPAHRTVADDHAARAAILADRIDDIVFATSEAVHRLAAVLGAALHELDGARITCIGPRTAAAARDHGLPVDAVAPEASFEALVAAVLQVEGEIGDRCAGKGLPAARSAGREEPP
ncbi:MAG TPA: uroporphyrinogen-III C-methyltransferase [Chloroflexota bacterium]|nr:uroporphyrinogen-III C-methyltransferase [Chloroflexota bacterium]